MTEEKSNEVTASGAASPSQRNDPDTASSSDLERLIAAVRGRPELSRVRTVRGKLIVWILFGVIFGLLPLIVNGVVAEMSRGGFDLTKALESGELFISSSAIAAGALGEMFYADIPHESKVARSACGAGCLLMCLCSASAYLAVSTSTPETVRNLSLVLFFLTVLAGAGSIGLAAGR